MVDDFAAVPRSSRVAADDKSRGTRGGKTGITGLESFSQSKTEEISRDSDPDAM